MATVKELEQALIAADAAGDTTAAQALAADLQRMTQLTTEKPMPVEEVKPETPEYQEGAAIAPGVRSLMNVGQGATLGWADELYGLGAGGLSKVTGGDFQSAYEKGRNIYRAGVQSFNKEYPGSSLLGSVASGTLLTGPMAAGSRAIGIKNPLGNAATLGGLTGGVFGAGEAENLAETPGKAAWGAVKGAAGSVAMQAPVSAVSAMTTAARAAGGNQPSIDKLALQRVAEAYARDEVDPTRLWRNLSNRYREGSFVDAGGENVRRTLDVTASIPGKTGNQVEREITRRQATRPERMTKAAEEGLNVGGQRFATTVQALDDEQKRVAGPLYEQLRSMSVQPDDELRSLLNRAAPFIGEAKKTAGVKGVPFELDEKAQNIPLSQLDQLKRSLFDAEEAAKIEGRATDMSRAVTDLRRALIAKLDDMTTDQTGVSIYKMARNAYAGPAELKDASKKGYEFWGKKAFKLEDELGGLNPSEKQAFRIGAFEALREKAGTMSGQNQLLNMWKEPTTREKLKVIFNSDSEFRKFAREIAIERQMKTLEKVGRGSQTFQRESAADDLALRLATDVAEGSTNPGAIATVMKTANNLWQRVSTPETVRNEMGRVLLMSPKQMGAEEKAKQLAKMIQQYQSKQPTGAAGASLMTIFSGAN